MNNDQQIAHIQRLQRELAAMRAYQRRYLDRRRQHGISTLTDATMEGHQQIITEALDLLETYRAEKAGQAEG